MEAQGHLRTLQQHSPLIVTDDVGATNQHMVAGDILQYRTGKLTSYRYILLPIIIE